MYATKKLIPAAIGATGLALASLAAVGSTPASASQPTCKLTVQSNKVLNLQDGGNNDEIFFKLGSNQTPTQQYLLNQKRTNIGSETFQGTIDVKVFEVDNNNLTRVGTLSNVPCSNNPGQLDDVSDGNAIYRVKWSVK